MGLAIMQYTQDADETMPSATGDGNTNWAIQIFPYAKSKGLFTCPDWAGNVTLNNDNVGMKIPAAYMANAGDTGNGFNGQRAMANGLGDTQTTLAMETSPSSTIVLNGQKGSRKDPQWYGASDIWNNHFENHTGMSNYLFCDGHVKALRAQATGSPINMWNVNNTTNNGDPNVGPVDTTKDLWKALVGEQSLAQ